MKTTMQANLKDAQKNHYAIPAFNVYNLEFVRAVISVAEELNSPVILAITPGTNTFSQAHFMRAIIKEAEQHTKVPIIHHLDHHTDIEAIKASIDLGVKSVMIDASAEPFEENIKRTQEVVAYAHPRGVSVEAELGKLIGIEDDLVVGEKDAALTDPKKAQEFVERTNVDALAVAIGTAHGLYKDKPKLDFNRLKTIAKKLDIPLVLHGASGLSERAVRECIQLGITKVNIATELKIPFAAAIRDYLTAHPDEMDPRKYLTPAIEAIKPVIRAKIKMCQSKGKA